MSFFREPVTSKTKIEIELDLSNHVTKSETQQKSIHQFV